MDLATFLEMVQAATPDAAVAQGYNITIYPVRRIAAPVAPEQAAPGTGVR